MIREFLTSLALAAGIAGNVAAAPALEPAVNFLTESPRIDGVLDAGLESLPVRSFPEVTRDDPGNAAPAVTWRMAYGTDFLYLFIEVAADRAVYRDRGYQNGDGFHLVLARSRPSGEATEEFYVLAFSAVEDPASFYRQLVWYYNIDLAFRPLDHGTRFEVRSTGGRTGFELMVPWPEVYPYHPWLSEGIGFNLCFVKAEAGGHRTFYRLVQDPRMQSEQSRRRYVPLAFQPPSLETGIQTCLVMDRSITAGTRATARVATLAASAEQERIRVRVLSGEGDVLDRQTYPFECQPGLATHTIELPTGGLPPGGYRVEWLARSGPPRGEIGLTVLPSVSLDDLAGRLRSAGGRIAPGSRTTLEFRLEELGKGLQRRFPYETAAGVRWELDHVMETIAQAEAGVDLLGSRRGVFRRAFRSRLDGTLQPYSVYIPPDFHPGRTYPLLVYLHGSGQDDRDQLNWLQAEAPELLAVAPFARGTSHYYTTPEAQADIQEAVEDMRRNYPVDPTRVVLAGFSMGGYGVYRTFAETPALYQALAVFSGRPNPGKQMADRENGEIDFLQPGQLDRFRDRPMFIVHGRLDVNCPFAETDLLVYRLKEAHARVEFRIDETGGHNTSAAARTEFIAWLKRLWNPPPAERKAEPPR